MNLNLMVWFEEFFLWYNRDLTDLFSETRLEKFQSVIWNNQFEFNALGAIEHTAERVDFTM